MQVNKSSSVYNSILKSASETRNDVTVLNIQAEEALAKGNLSQSDYEKLTDKGIAKQKGK